MELIVNGLKKCFRNAEGNVAFQLDIPQIRFDFGKVSYVMGSNGSGKSLFLSLLSGEVAPSLGALKINIGDESCFSSDLDISLVRQVPEKNLCIDLSVEENVILGYPARTLAERLFPKKRLRDDIAKILGGQSVLKNKNTQLCSKLSGGERQLLAFLLAIARNTRQATAAVCRCLISPRSCRQHGQLPRHSMANRRPWA